MWALCLESYSVARKRSALTRPRAPNHSRTARYQLRVVRPQICVRGRDARAHTHTRTHTHTHTNISGVVSALINTRLTEDFFAFPEGVGRPPLPGVVSEVCVCGKGWVDVGGGDHGGAVESRWEGHVWV